jgi:hypothetical protein
MPVCPKCASTVSWLDEVTIARGMLNSSVADRVSHSASRHAFADVVPCKKARHDVPSFSLTSFVAVAQYREPG